MRYQEALDLLADEDTMPSLYYYINHDKYLKAINILQELIDKEKPKKPKKPILLKEVECRGTIIFTFSSDGVDIACHAKEKDLITAFFRLGEIIIDNQKQGEIRK